MEQNFNLNMELYILVSDLSSDNLTKDSEIEISNADIIGTLNKTPAYRIKLKSEDGMIIGQVVKILSPRESDKNKEKFLI
ncbi:hypothetical protein [Persephonella sp.]